LNPLVLLMVVPLLMAVSGLFTTSIRWLPGFCAVLMLAQLPLAGWICYPVLQGHALDYGLIRVDGVGAAFTLITTLVAAAALVQAALTLPADRRGAHPVSDRRFCLFFSLAGLFIASMYLVPLAQHPGLMWIAIEATTLMSVPLISYHQSRASLEASWKYLLLCSVGIALALFGTALLCAAQLGAPGGGASLVAHFDNPALLDQRLLALGFIFCLLGYGTKAGIFPLHNWLPDAHSEAPASVSALLSGALLNCALVAIWRLSQLMVAAGQGELVRQLLVPAGAITVAAASLMLIRQHDLKRMLAYSSVEHVGLLTLAIGIGSGPLFILHALNHSIAKVAFFLLAGLVLQIYGTRVLSRLSGILRTAPALGLALLVASFAIAGAPPFGTFISEWLLLRDTLGTGYGLAAAVVIAGLAAAFVAITTHTGRIVLGHGAASTAPVAATKLIMIPAVLLGCSLLLGVMITPQVWQALASLINVGAR
jgi:hydrogenase-4 component F